MRKLSAMALTLAGVLALWLAEVIWPRDLRGKQVIIVEPPVTEEDTQPAIGWDALIGEYRSGWRIIEREGFDQQRQVE